MSTLTPAVKAELGSVYCQIQKADFHLWTASGRTQASSNWWIQTTISFLPWKTHLFKCVDILMGRKAKRKPHILLKTRQVSILKLRYDGFAQILHTIKDLQNAMGFTLATEVALLHLHQPSWVVKKTLKYWSLRLKSLCKITIINIPPLKVITMSFTKTSQRLHSSINPALLCRE